MPIRRFRPLIPLILDLGFLSVLLALIEASTSRFELKNSLFQLANLFGAPWALNLGILYSLYSVLRLVLARRSRAFALLLFLALVVSASNFLKLSYLNLPILPSDLYLMTEIGLLVSFVSPAFLVALGGIVLVVIVATAWVERRLEAANSLLRPTRRAKLLPVAIAGMAYLAAVVHFQDLGLEQPLRSRGIGVNHSDPYYETWHDGLLLTYAMHVEHNLALIPEGYSEERMRSLVDRYRGRGRAASDSHPNVVLVQLESVWDVAPLAREGGSVAPDPLAHLKRLGETGVVGQLVSPVFGGRTANVEFEVLTGLSTRFLPRGSVAFQQFLARRTESLAYKFKRSGFRTIALHNWHGSFWRRDKVYPWLGFDEYQGMESLGVPKPERGYPEDSALYDRMIREISESKSPVFGMVITVSTHGGYQHEPSSGMNESEKVRISGTRLKGEILREAENYATAVLHSDRAFGAFAKRLEAMGEETLVIVFGDHLPVLGLDFAAYFATGVVSGALPSKWSLEEKLAMASTPLAIWSSKRSLKGAIEGAESYRVSPNFLGDEALRLAGVKSVGPLELFLAELRQAVPVVHPDFAIAREGRFLAEDDPLSTMLEDYRLFTYDRVFGEAYSSPR